MNQLEKRVEELEKRNIRVDQDKAWETSKLRKITILISTYLIMSIFLTTIEVERPLINAVVPTLGFYLSTLTLPAIKKLWIKYTKKK